MALNYYKEAYSLLECDSSQRSYRTETLGFYKYSTDLKICFQLSLHEDFKVINFYFH